MPTQKFAPSQTTVVETSSGSQPWKSICAERKIQQRPRTSRSATTKKSLALVGVPMEEAFWEQSPRGYRYPNDQPDRPVHRSRVHVLSIESNGGRTCRYPSTRGATVNLGVVFAAAVRTRVTLPLPLPPQKNRITVGWPHTHNNIWEQNGKSDHMAFCGDSGRRLKSSTSASQLQNRLHRSAVRPDCRFYSEQRAGFLNPTPDCPSVSLFFFFSSQHLYPTPEVAKKN